MIVIKLIKLINNGGDGNENAKKSNDNTVKIGKTTTLQVYHAFLIHFL